MQLTDKWSTVTKTVVLMMTICVRRCSARELTAHTGDADEDFIGDNDKDAAAADVDEPSSYPAPEIESCDQLADVTVAPDNPYAPTVKPFSEPVASESSLVSLTPLRFTMLLLTLYGPLCCFKPT